MFKHQVFLGKRRGERERRTEVRWGQQERVPHWLVDKEEGGMVCEGVGRGERVRESSLKCRAIPIPIGSAVAKEG